MSWKDGLNWHIFTIKAFNKTLQKSLCSLKKGILHLRLCNASEATSEWYLRPNGILDGLLGLQRGQKSGENTTEIIGRYYGMEALQSSPVWGLGDLHSFSGSGWTTHRPFNTSVLHPQLLPSRVSSSPVSGFGARMLPWGFSCPELGKEEPEGSVPSLWVQLSLFRPAQRALRGPRWGEEFVLSRAQRTCNTSPSLSILIHSSSIPRFRGIHLSKVI